MGTKSRHYFILNGKYPLRYFDLYLDDDWYSLYEAAFDSFFEEGPQECYGWFVRTLLILGLHGENLRVR